MLACILAGCGETSIFGLSDRQKAKYYQAVDLINAANVDYGDRYDRLVEAYFNISLDYDTNIRIIEEYFNNGLIDVSILESCRDYKQYSDSMIGDFRVDYSTNGNPKTNTGIDMSNVFSMIEQLERGWIGTWMYAIPEDEMSEVLNAYHDNKLLLDFENGNYTIVDYQTDVYGNLNGKNDLSRKLDLTITDDVYDNNSEQFEENDEYSEYLEENKQESCKYTKYEILSKNVFAKFIVYNIVDPKSQVSSNFTVIISDGKVVSINGGFNGK